MSGTKLGIYWRICWGFIAPILMIFALICTFLEYKPLKYKNVEYPEKFYGTFENSILINLKLKKKKLILFIVIGWILLSIGILQIPIWAIHAILKQYKKSETNVRVFIFFYFKF